MKHCQQSSTCSFSRSWKHRAEHSPRRSFSGQAICHCFWIHRTVLVKIIALQIRRKSTLCIVKKLTRMRSEVMLMSRSFRLNHITKNMHALISWPACTLADLDPQQNFHVSGLTADHLATFSGCTSLFFHCPPEQTLSFRHDMQFLKTPQLANFLLPCHLSSRRSHSVCKCQDIQGKAAGHNHSTQLASIHAPLKPGSPREPLSQCKTLQTTFGA